jgi:hypothetical protein
MRKIMVVGGFAVWAALAIALSWKRQPQVVPIPELTVQERIEEVIDSWAQPRVERRSAQESLDLVDQVDCQRIHVLWQLGRGEVTPAEAAAREDALQVQREELFKGG